MMRKVNTQRTRYVLEKAIRKWRKEYKKRIPSEGNMLPLINKFDKDNPRIKYQAEIIHDERLLYTLQIIVYRFIDMESLASGYLSVPIDEKTLKPLYKEVGLPRLA